MSHVHASGKIGGIALPPILLHQIPCNKGAQLMLFHLTTDMLCQWHPSDDTLRALACNIA